MRKTKDGADEAVWHEIGIDPEWWTHSAMGRFLVQCDAVVWLRRDEVEGANILFCMAAHEEVGEGIPRIGEEVIVWPIGPAHWEQEVARQCAKLTTAHLAVAVAQPGQVLATDSRENVLEWMGRRWEDNRAERSESEAVNDVREAFRQIEALRRKAQPRAGDDDGREVDRTYENEDALHERAWSLVTEFSLRQTQWQSVEQWEDPHEPLLCANSYRIRMVQDGTTIEIEGPTVPGATGGTKVRACNEDADEYAAVALKPGWDASARWLAARLGV